MSLQPANTHAKPRMGRIGYLNVLPIYHALESGVLPHNYELVYGPPAELNNSTAAGELAVSSTSCVEYARRPERYLLLPNLSIGSNGPVKSVLLLSRIPVEELDGHSVLVSAETHTSAALLRLLFTEQYRFSDIAWMTGSATERVASGNPPRAFLAIGDEALRLRNHPQYPYTLDLGDAWTEWTGLPFTFGLWVADRQTFMRNGKPYIPSGMENPGTLLDASRNWGLSNMEHVLDIAEQNYTNMTRREHADYFNGLYYSLGDRELEGLLLFWEKLARRGEIAYAPQPSFLPAG